MVCTFEGLLPPLDLRVATAQTHVEGASGRVTVDERGTHVFVDLGGVKLSGDTDTPVLQLRSPITAPGYAVPAGAFARAQVVGGEVRWAPAGPAGFVGTGPPTVAGGAAVALRLDASPTTGAFVFRPGHHEVRLAPEGRVFGAFDGVTGRVDVRGRAGDHVHVVVGGIDGWVPADAVWSTDEAPVVIGGVVRGIVGELGADGRRVVHDPPPPRLTCGTTPVALVDPNGDDVIVGTFAGTEPYTVSGGELAIRWRGVDGTLRLPKADDDCTIDG